MAEKGLTSDQPEAETPDKPLSMPPLLVLALLTGSVAGIGAVIFRGLIGIIHNFLFLGQLSWAYDAKAFTGSESGGRWSSWCR